MADLEFDDGTFFSPMQKQILDLLDQNGAMSRKDLVKKMNKPRTTIYDNLMGLMHHNLITKFSQGLNLSGRPIVYFKRIV
jgi:predicted transcriptional regulator